MSQVYSNSARTTLVALIDNSATTMTVTSAAAFPVLVGADYFYATLYRGDVGAETDVEIVKVTATSSTIFTIVRGQEGTTVQNYITLGGTCRVDLRLTAAGVTGLLQAADNLSALTNLTTARSNLGLGTSATKNVGTSSTEVSAGDHAHTADQVLPSQGSNNGKYLTTNGTTASWAEAAAGVEFSVVREVKTATSNQTVFDLTNTYVTGINAIMVYQNGARLISTDYTETDTNTVTLTTGATTGDELLFEIGVVAAGTSIAAGNVSYSPTGGIAATNVQAALTELDGEAAKLATANTFTAQQTFAEIKETAYSLTGTDVDPANGTLQYKTLSGNTTLTESLESGQYVTLMVDDGTTYAITWPTITWTTDAGAAPTLNTSGYTTIVIWKLSTALFGARVGDA